MRIEMLLLELLISFAWRTHACLRHRYQYCEVGAIEAFYGHLNLFIPIDRTALTLFILFEREAIVFRAGIACAMTLGKTANRFCIDAFTVGSLHLFD